MQFQQFDNRNIETSNAPNPSDNEIEKLLSQIKDVEHHINELQNNSKVEDETRKRKIALSDGLKADIAELSEKLKKVQLEIQDMKLHVFDDESLKEQQINEQLNLLERLRIEINSLRLKLQEYENLTIEGFTDAEIIDLRELLDKVGIYSLSND